MVVELSFPIIIYPAYTLTDGTGQEWVNSKRVLGASNILVVQVTATPYCLQSIASMVSVDMPLKNEVYWNPIPEQYCGIEVTTE